MEAGGGGAAADEEYRAAFVERLISRPCRERIGRIRNNDPDFVEFTLQAGVANHFSDSAWRLLGRYIEGNDYLESIRFRTRLLDDSRMSLLFGELRGGGRALRRLELTKTDFGMDGVRAMVPFLRRSNLAALEISQNESFNTGCFRLLVGALDGRSVESLRVRCCDIDSNAALETCTLPRLRLLNLDQNELRSIPPLRSYDLLEHVSLEGNWIGRRGYGSIATLLRSECSPVKSLDLTFTGMRDPEAELISRSLERNASLNHLRLEGNKIEEEGRRAFLRLLNDVSSIGATYRSNHSLRSLELPRSFDLRVVRMFHHIDLAIQINKENAGRPHAAGREKVVATQLRSETRRELSGLQCLEYRYDGLFPQIDPVLLPNVLAVVGERHGRGELFSMLKATAPDLASVVDRRSALVQRLADNASRIDAIDAEYEIQASALLAEYRRRLAALTSEKQSQTDSLSAENLYLREELRSID